MRIPQSQTKGEAAEAVEAAAEAENNFLQGGLVSETMVSDLR